MSRTTTTGAAAAALALALTACGGGDGGPGPTEGGHSTAWETPGASEGEAKSTTSDSSATSTSDPSVGQDPSDDKDASSSDSSSPESSSSSTDTGEPFDAKEFTDKIDRAVEKNPTVSIEVLLTVNGEESGTASGVQDLGEEALDMELDFGGQELGYRLVDGRYYLAQGSKWIPVTEGSTNPAVEQALDQAELLSMRKQLDAFVAGVEQAGDKGEEKIDGVSTTHYTATVDTAKAFESLGTKKDAGAPDTMIYDVWLDDDDLIRRMSFTQEGSEAVMNATDWGEPVSIDKPKDSDLAE